MASASLELFKKHVNADDFGGDDDYLQHLLDTAEEAVVASTGRTPAELLEMGDGGFPRRLMHAEMMLAAHWYSQRESAAAAQMHSVPDALDALVKPYRKLGRR